jgi:two-component system, cell cycle response regulator DivK
MRLGEDRSLKVSMAAEAQSLRKRARSAWARARQAQETMLRAQERARQAAAGLSKPAGATPQADLRCCLSELRTTADSLQKALADVARETQRVTALLEATERRQGAQQPACEAGPSFQTKAMMEPKPPDVFAPDSARAALGRCRRTLARAAYTLTEAEKAVARTRRTLPPLLLVVDGVADDRDFFSRWFAGNGFRVATAQSGTEALDLVLQMSPAAVLLDLVLPDFDGLDVARALHEDAETAKIPIIAISASLPLHSQERAADAGCRGFIAKPCPPDELLVLLQSVLRRAV